MPAASRRVFLFLQGPASPFMERVAVRLEAMGHAARRINISFGDRLFWRRPGAVHFRGSIEEWPSFLAAYCTQEGVTDIVLLGDCRPHHIEAIRHARERGIGVFVTELGYLRPDWVTIERDGMTTFSHFPRDPESIRALAATVPEPDLAVRYTSDFGTMVRWDVAYNLANVFLSPLFHPYYKWHAIRHPLAEYAGWIRKFVRAPRTRRRTGRDYAALMGSGAPFYVFPLQLATDYQIRAHSRFRDLETVVRLVVSSFAAHAPAEARLAVKVHPLDNGLIPWGKVLAGAAAACGVEGRVTFLEGGNLNSMLKAARGCVTVNSTTGITALRFDCPVVALGNAIYDVPGLTHQGPLDTFWTEAERPDSRLRDAFIRALVGATQVKGGYYNAEAIEAAAEAVAEKLTGGLLELRRTAPQDRDAVLGPRAAE